MPLFRSLAEEEPEEEPRGNLSLFSAEGTELVLSTAAAAAIIMRE